MSGLSTDDMEIREIRHSNLSDLFFQGPVPEFGTSLCAMSMLAGILSIRAY